MYLHVQTNYSYKLSPEFRGRVDLFEYNRVGTMSIELYLKLTFIDRYTSSGGVSWFTE